MKGVILAGGSGSRLYPLTKVTNKNLLPVGNKPMLQHCLERFTEAGIKDILIISGKEQFGLLASFVGSGSDFGCNITLKVQDAPNGIAQAVGLSNGFVAESDDFCVLLGDNVFECPIDEHVKKFKNRNRYVHAQITLKEVPDPERFGCPRFNTEEIVEIEEKPKQPASRYAVIGLYFYDYSVFDIIKRLKPSARGEFEISDVNQVYVNTKELSYTYLIGDWVDAGTFESLTFANQLANKMRYVNVSSVQ